MRALCSSLKKMLEPLSHFTDPGAPECENNTFVGAVLGQNGFRTIHLWERFWARTGCIVLQPSWPRTACVSHTPPPPFSARTAAVR